MTIPEKAADWARRIALDDTHGYDQGIRWGPDYDCSSLCIQAYREAGVPLTCTYTGNMRSNMLDNGFIQPDDVNLNTGAGLKTGDILLNVISHAAIYIGGGKLVNAGGNEHGRATGGQPGDQTGKEIMIMNYYNFPWDYCLRYARAEPEPEPEDGWYTVKSGDTLWGLAEKFLGDPWRYTEIMTMNNLSSDLIHPGQRIRIPGAVSDDRITLTVNIKMETYDKLSNEAALYGVDIDEMIDRLTEDLF